jgi:hypothetical protein
LTGSIGGIRASLSLTITDKTCVDGQLRVDGLSNVHVDGWIYGDGTLMLELANSVTDVTTPEYDFAIPVRMVPALVGRFDGQTFLGESRTDHGPAIGPFQFVITD